MIEHLSFSVCIFSTLEKILLHFFHNGNKKKLFFIYFSIKKCPSSKLNLNKLVYQIYIWNCAHKTGLIRTYVQIRWLRYLIAQWTLANVTLFFIHLVIEMIFIQNMYFQSLNQATFIKILIINALKKHLRPWKFTTQWMEYQEDILVKAFFLHNINFMSVANKIKQQQ